MSMFDDKTGRIYGKLTVVSRADNHLTPSGQSITMWNCICECGKEVCVSAQNLNTGHTSSCGCTNKQHNLKHGGCIGKQERLYRIWSGIKARCYSTGNYHYQLYGARGIKMCPEWKESFNNFKEWAKSSGYNDTLSIDRINVDGDYEPSNCRWATQMEQSNNTRTNVKVKYNGEDYTIAELSRRCQIPYKTLWYRLNRGWSVEEAVITPLRWGGNSE